MTREPEEEETAGAAALAGRCRSWPGQAGAGAGARRAPLWLLCLVVCWLLGAVADADFSILDEAQVLASQMRRLAVEELGVVTMQGKLARLLPQLKRMKLIYTSKGPLSQVHDLKKTKDSCHGIRTQENKAFQCRKDAIFIFTDTRC